MHEVESPPANAIAAAGEGLAGVWLLVKETEAAKCARCWHRRPDVGQNAGAPGAVRPLLHQHLEPGREANLRMSEPNGWRWLPLSAA